MARDWHYTKLSLSSALLLYFYGMCGEHVSTMVVLQVFPERSCMLGKFPVVFRDRLS